jgi:ATP-dependent Lon protease
MNDTKLRDVFADMVVLKRPDRAKFFSDLSLPAYMRDWLVMKFSDNDGNVDTNSVSRYIKQYLPTTDEYEHLKYQMVNGETVRLLARIRISIDMKSGNTLFELPDFGGTKAGAGGEISKVVTNKWQNTLFSESEHWGILDLAWEQDFSKKPPRGIVRLVAYQPFCPYRVDLDFYRDARRQFTTEEWLDVLITAVDYNPKGYDSEAQRLFFIRRLLPFVERRMNLIELAPLGTGKSYVFDNISKYGWLVAAGTQSRSTLFYNNNTRTPGLVTQFDFVAFDEIQTMKFIDPAAIQTALKGYMETGNVKGFEAQIPASAGIIILGNVDVFDSNANLVDSIHPVFKEAALDRFHGFIPGWEIPRFHQGLITDGWALNTQYFADVLHELRTESVYDTLVSECLEIPEKADKRDVTAIERLCAGFIKLIFPHATNKLDITEEEFVKYCLEPAKDMRQIIRNQLSFIKAKEFGGNKLPVADIQYRK